MPYWVVMSETSRFCSSAPTVAVPRTRPTCRTVFSTPDAAPAIRGSMLRMAMVVSGANVQPIPTPATSRQGRNTYQADVGVAMKPSQPIPTANRNRPVIRMYLPPILSVIRPATGATNIAITDAGAMVSPAFSAEKPSTDCR